MNNEILFRADAALKTEPGQFHAHPSHRGTVIVSVIV